MSKQEGVLPSWCSGNIVDLANRLLPSSSEQSGMAKRRRALVQGILTKNTCGTSNLQNWGCDRVNRAVTNYRKVRLREYVRTELPDFTESLIVISFGARDGGFQLSQDIRQWILSHTGLHKEDIYHDYASLVGHPLSKVVVGDDGITRQLNENWNVYFSNALAASPVMIFIVSEAWTQSAWCALEHRQRDELKIIKQAPGYKDGKSTYEKSSHSNPDDAAFVPPPSAEERDTKKTVGQQEKVIDTAAASAVSYLDRHAEMLSQLEEIRTSWKQETFEEVTESVYRKIAFGSKKNELYIFVDHDGSLKEEAHKEEAGQVLASDAIKQVHTSVPEYQRFYHTPWMNEEEKALEMHALCVRLTEVIEEQAQVESMGNGKEMNRRIDAAFEALTTESGEKSSSNSKRSTPCSSLNGLRQLAAEEDARQKQEEKRKREARLNAMRKNAIQCGLKFDTGPCPF
jgi:hypothetical protein